MDKSMLKGIAFGLTSGTITTLGLIVGLHSGTRSAEVVIGGILVIAIADALSDALGIHISEESDNQSDRSVWTATGATFLSKLVFALTFLVPMLVFELNMAIIVSIAWGLLMISVFSYYIAKNRKERAVHVIGEHLFIAILVIVATHFVGDMVSLLF